MRTTRKDLETLLGMLRAATGREDLDIGYAYGRPRLEARGGSVDVSPRLATGELAMWMRAALAGIDLAGSR